MIVPGRSSTLGADTPQSPSPPTIPGGAVALARTDLASACLFILLLGRRIPIDPPAYVGCGFDDFPNYVGHMGIDFYKTVGDVYVARSCDFQGTGVPGANVYPAFPGCPHQGTAGKAKVIYAADTGDAEIGKCIILEHTDNTHLIWIRTVYMHLDTFVVAAGAFVTTTDVIGTVGHAPIAPVTNSHLHFEVWEQRAANPGWRTAAELATMPDLIQLGRAVINPEKYLPPLEGGALLRVASPPPPAGNPGWYPLPDWTPQVQFPCDGGYAGHVITGIGTNNVHIDGAVVGGTMDVYPFMDAPEGKIYVVNAAAGAVSLAYGSYPYDTWFYTGLAVFPGTSVVHVSSGDWVDMNTKLLTITALGPAVFPGVFLTLDRIDTLTSVVAHVPPGNYFWRF